jgi:hypothetical protein
MCQECGHRLKEAWQAGRAVRNAALTESSMWCYVQCTGNSANVWLSSLDSAGRRGRRITSRARFHDGSRCCFSGTALQPSSSRNSTSIPGNSSPERPMRMRQEIDSGDRPREATADDTTRYVGRSRCSFKKPRLGDSPTFFTALHGASFGWDESPPRKRASRRRQAPFQHSR